MILLVVVRPVSPTPVFTSVKPMMSTARAFPMETFCGDVPGYFVPAMIPVSPSSVSYKMMFDRMPFQYQTKKSSKKRDDDFMRDDDVERRMSVRQSECAYKYKEIVVKKCNRYTQIWLNTHTKLKNSLNPQVSLDLQVLLIYTDVVTYMYQTEILFEYNKKVLSIFTDLVENIYLTEK